MQQDKNGMGLQEGRPQCCDEARGPRHHRYGHDQTAEAEVIITSRVSARTANPSFHHYMQNVCLAWDFRKRDATSDTQTPPVALERHSTPMETMRPG